jgi:hypothetical protein
MPFRRAPSCATGPRLGRPSYRTRLPEYESRPVPVGRGSFPPDPHSPYQPSGGAVTPILTPICLGVGSCEAVHALAPSRRSARRLPSAHVAAHGLSETRRFPRQTRSSITRSSSQIGRARNRPAVVAKKPEHSPAPKPAPTGPTGPTPSPLNLKTPSGRPFAGAGFSFSGQKTGPTLRPHPGSASPWTAGGLARGRPTHAVGRRARGAAASRPVALTAG